jgi:hypothetical protein
LDVVEDPEVPKINAVDLNTAAAQQHEVVGVGINALSYPDSVMEDQVQMTGTALDLQSIPAPKNPESLEVNALDLNIAAIQQHDGDGVGLNALQMTGNELDPHSSAVAENHVHMGQHLIGNGLESIDLYHEEALSNPDHANENLEIGRVLLESIDFDPVYESFCETREVAKWTPNFNAGSIRQWANFFSPVNGLDGFQIPQG